MEKSRGKQTEETKRNSPRGQWPVELRLEKRGLRVPGLQPLVPIGDEGHQLLFQLCREKEVRGRAKKCP